MRNGQHKSHDCIWQSPSLMKKNLRATFRRSFSVSTLPTSSFFFPVVCWEEMQLILYTHHLVGRRETKEYAVSIGQGMNSTALICRFLLPARLSFPFTSEHAFLSNLFFKKKEKNTLFCFCCSQCCLSCFQACEPTACKHFKGKELKKAFKMIGVSCIPFHFTCSPRPWHKHKLSHNAHFLQ